MLTLCDPVLGKGVSWVYEHHLSSIWTVGEKKVESTRTYEWIYNITRILIAVWLWESCLPFLRDSVGAMGQSLHPEHFGSGSDSPTTSWVTLTKGLDFRNLCLHVSIMEKAMAPHSSTLAWKIPWTGEPGRLQSMGSRTVGHDFTFTFTFHFHALEKEMATHSSVLAWRIPGTGEPAGLPSMGSHSWTRLQRLSSSSMCLSWGERSHWVTGTASMRVRFGLEFWLSHSLTMNVLSLP